MLTFKKYLKECFTAITAFGTAYFYSLLIIFLFIINQKTKAMHLLIALPICYILVLTFRLFYFKERPEKEDYFNLFTKLNASSFPSLHTFTFTLTATVLSTITKTTKTTIFFYTIALLVAYSRLYIKKHYMSDIFAGLVLGILASIIYLLLT